MPCLVILQVVAAKQLGLNPVLIAATNSSGGVMGKMISPQNIATGVSVTHLQGQEGRVLARTFIHSVILTLLLGVLVVLQQYVFCLDDPVNARTSPAGGTQPPPADVCHRLERRLRRETRGEVLFDPAARGRYATDASIYQISPVGVFVPLDARDVSTAIDIARDLRVPVLARGGGTSQCGQTVGAALIIDLSKHLRRILEVDPAGAVALVEPGLVLDDLNAALSPHGLWFPVDVSTGAQATLGGMAGNNSCGSRSIAYGNMVHNVLGLDVWLSDGTRVELGPVRSLEGRAARIATFVRDLAARNRDSIAARWPKVMRRVGGYNLDIFDNQSERPYTADGEVNLSHLARRLRGHAGAHSQRCGSSSLPSRRIACSASSISPSFRAAMLAPQHLVDWAERHRADRSHHDRSGT